MEYECKYKCGTIQSTGHYTCCNCGTKIYLEENEKLPPCPKCSNETYTKDEE